VGTDGDRRPDLATQRAGHAVESLAVAAQGRLEREGNLTWLYDARLVAVYPAEDQRSVAVRASQPHVTGQLSLDDVDQQEGGRAPPDWT
jgi:hypothetical protein